MSKHLKTRCSFSADFINDSGDANIRCQRISNLVMQVTFISTGATQSITAQGIQFSNPYSSIIYPMTMEIFGFRSCDQNAPAYTYFTAINSNASITFLKQTSFTGLNFDASSNIVGDPQSILTINRAALSTGQYDYLSPNTGRIVLQLDPWYKVGNEYSATPRIQITSNSDCYSENSNLMIQQCTYQVQEQNSTTLVIQYYGYVENSEIIIKVKNFKNSVVSRYMRRRFTLQTVDSGDNIICEDTTGNLTVFGPYLDPAPISDLKVILTQDSIVQSITQIKIETYLFPIPVQMNCKIEITFPSDVNLNQTLLQNIQVTGIFKNSQSSTLTLNQVTFTGQTLTYQGCNDASQLILSGSKGPINNWFTITNVKLPKWKKDTNDFILTLSNTDIDDNGYASSIYQILATGTTKIFAEKLDLGHINLNYFYPISTNGHEPMQNNVQYKLSITPQHELNKQSIIIVEVPHSITTIECSISSIGSYAIMNALCVYQSPNKWVLKYDFTNPNALVESNGLYPGGSDIIFTLGLGTNPPYGGQVGQWNVTTLEFDSISNDYYQIDIGNSSESFETLRGEITPVSVISTNMTTFNEDAIYTFKFDTEHDIPIGGYVYVQSPEQFIFKNVGCKYGYLGVHSDTTCVFNMNFVGIKITNGHTVSLGQSLEVVVSKVINPRSFAPYGNFTLSTHPDSSPLKVIDEGYGLQIQMTDMALIDSVQIVPTSLVNGDITNYTISINLQNYSSIPIPQILPNETLFLNFPQEIALQSSQPVLCIALNITSSLKNVSCTAQGQILQITFRNISSTNGTFTFVLVRAAKNPPNTRISSVFTNIHYRNQYNFPVKQFLAPLTITNSIPAMITDAILSQTNDIQGQQSVYTLRFTPINPISQTGVWVIYYPSQVTISPSATCIVFTFNKFTSNCVIDAVIRVIKVAGVWGPTTWNQQVQLDIQVTNPTSNNMVDPFYFNTYDDAAIQYSIDQYPFSLSVLYPSLLCNVPCKTCTTGNKNYCTSCWKPSVSQNLQPIVGGIATCKPKCDAGWTTNGDVNQQCQLCDTSCQTCQDQGLVGDKFKCITCSSGFNFYKDYTQCIKGCPTGYFSQGGSCLQCQAPCLSCSEISSQCTACNQTGPFPFLLDGTCVNRCRNAQIVVNQQCQKCESPCLTCQNSTDICLQCDGQNGKNYLYGFKCYQQCPPGTVQDSNSLQCIGCQTGCLKCDERNQSQCLSCDKSLVNFFGSCQVACPQGFNKSSLGICEPIKVLPSINNTQNNQSTGVKNNNTNSNNTNNSSDQNSTGGDYSYNNLLSQAQGIVTFPNVITTGVLGSVAGAAFVMNPSFQIVSNMVAFMGPVETFCFGLQFIYSCLKQNNNENKANQRLLFGTSLDQPEEVKNDPKLMVLSALPFFLTIIFNIGFFLYFRRVLKQDEGFREWRSEHYIMYPIISYAGLIFSFKINKMLYSFLFKLECFNATFYQPQRIIRTFIFFQIPYLLLCYIPIIFADLTYLSYAKWGTQFFVFTIESLILTGLSIILTILELARLNSLIKRATGTQDKNLQTDGLFNDKSASQIYPEQDNNTLDIYNEDSQKAKQNLAQIKRFRDELEAKLDDLKGQKLERSQSMIQLLENDKNKDPRKHRSFEQSPNRLDGEEKAKNDIKLKEWIEDFRQYYKGGKEKVKEIIRRQTIKLESLVTNQGEDLTKSMPDNDLDDQIINNQEGNIQTSDNLLDGKSNSSDSDEESKSDDQINNDKHLLDQDNLEQRTIEESDPVLRNVLRLERMIQFLLSKFKNIDELDKESQRKIEMELKKVQDQIDAELNKIPLVEMSQELPGQPPAAEKRNFNINDIMGEFDRDENGNIIIRADKDGILRDRLGRRVNILGYLIDPNENIIEGWSNTIVFDKDELDENGDIPGPFSLEKYNFNPHNIRGDFRQDMRGRLIFPKNKNRDIVDKIGRKVNQKGYLIDKPGNIMDKNTNKKFDKSQLTKDGEIPQLYNYDAKKYDISDVMGNLGKDTNGNTQFRQNARREFIDKRGRRVNEKGYLVDKDGNVITRLGKIVFMKDHLKNGEIPKIFQFTEFDVKRVTGVYDLDKNDEPKLYLDSNDEYMDNNGTKVNQSGYLIDKDYNVIDRYGYVIFEKHLLNKKGNIPKVFRKTPIEPSSDCDDLLDIPQKVDPKKNNNNKKTITQPPRRNYQPNLNQKIRNDTKSPVKPAVQNQRNLSQNRQAPTSQKNVNILQLQNKKIPLDFAKVNQSPEPNQMLEERKSQIKNELFQKVSSRNNFREDYQDDTINDSKEVLLGNNNLTFKNDQNAQNDPMRLRAEQLAVAYDDKKKITKRNYQSKKEQHQSSKNQLGVNDFFANGNSGAQTPNNKKKDYSEILDIL